jgi:hypothetical protein
MHGSSFKSMFLLLHINEYDAIFFNEDNITDQLIINILLLLLRSTCTMVSSTSTSSVVVYYIFTYFY